MKKIAFLFLAMNSAYPVLAENKRESLPDQNYEAPNDMIEPYHDFVPGNVIDLTDEHKTPTPISNPGYNTADFDVATEDTSDEMSATPEDSSEEGSATPTAIPGKRGHSPAWYRENLGYRNRKQATEMELGDEDLDPNRTYAGPTDRIGTPIDPEVEGKPIPKHREATLAELEKYAGSPPMVEGPTVWDYMKKTAAEKAKNSP